MTLPPDHGFAGLPGAESFLGGCVQLLSGDCLDVLPQLAENSIDACVCDPPYHLQSIVKRFGQMGPNDKKLTMGPVNPFQRTAGGFMNQMWDGGDIAFRPETWAAVYRVLKPGAYIVSFGGSRTYHRMACAIEDAGFITHPLIAWVTGQGFPKATSVSKGIDRMAGVVREIVGRNRYDAKGSGTDFGRMNDDGWIPGVRLDTAPATDAARQWDGWFYGTQSLKPAVEPIYVGQKPFEAGLNGTENVLNWGTGALNIDGCRVPTNETIIDDGRRTDTNCHEGYQHPNASMYTDKPVNRSGPSQPLGRWPANLIHDGSDQVLAAFPDAPGQQSYVGPEHGSRDSINCYGDYGERPPAEPRGDSGSAARFFASFPGNGRDGEPGTGGIWSPSSGKPCGPTYGDSGSAARFFYTSKADADDRLGSKHPTVKPIDLMQWLARLVTPPNGKILDPFAGTGTTGEAAFREGMRAVLIEREAAYCDDIRRRMALAMAGPVERTSESVKARNLPRDDGPLFGGTDLQGGHVRKTYGEFEHDKTGKRYEKPRDDGPLFATKPDPPRRDQAESDADFAGSLDEAYRAVRARVAAGGPPWRPKDEAAE
jgi:site-specific DNA-methyltransferase (adenine-specific)